jgi:hypothetical protein
VAAGLYVIACDIPGVQEAIVAARHKKLISLDANAAEWAEGISEALDAPRMTHEQRLAQLQDFPFTISRSVRSLMKVYEGGHVQRM